MEISEMYFCKICKKVFTDMNGLTKHKLAQHPQLTMMTEKEITHQFRNNSISITRIHKETNAVPSVMNHNPSPFRKTTSTAQSINARRAEVKMIKSAEGQGRMKVPVRNEAKMKVGASSIKSLVLSGMSGLEVEVDDDTTDWQKWEPAAIKETNTHEVDGGMANIITASVAERATSAFRITPDARAGTKGLKQAQPARKNVPPMYRISDVPVAKNGKRSVTAVSSTQQRTPAAGLRATAPAGNSSAVAGIMQNLGKMKSMNQAATTRPSPKVISLPSRPTVAPAKKSPVQVPVQQPYRVNKTPQVPKNKGKIMPRNAFNNALPKPGVGLGQPRPPHLENEMDFDDLNEEEYAFINPPELVEEPPQLSPAKAPPAAISIPSKSNNNNNNSNGAKAGGKIVAPKSLSSNRFNPIDAKNKSAELPAATSRNGNSTTKPSPNAVTSGKTNGNQSQVVAKKSAPKKKNSTPVNEELFKKIKKHAPSMPGTDYDMPRLDAVGTYSTHDGVQVWVCLVCEEQEHEQSSRDMICCDGCEDWYHWGCVGITQTFPEDQPWFCKRCIYHHSKNPVKEFPKLFKNNAKR